MPPAIRGCAPPSPATSPGLKAGETRATGPPPRLRCRVRGHYRTGRATACDRRETYQATDPRPFFATNVRSFSEAPRGRFSPRSHWLTKPAVTLR